jgi:tRNA(Ile)-lysidine synthetase-like protein
MLPATDSPLAAACRPIPPGRYAVGVSGGADSTALLIALHQTRGLWLHAVHLNHQTRGPDSDGDGEFVRDLAHRLGVACTIARRSDLESSLPNLPANPSARYRALRLALFGQVIREQDLAGVVLAHHGDDQAETVLFRLLRGSALWGLTGMSPDARVKSVRIFRPFLSLRKAEIQNFLQSLNQPWREDASNASPRYARNRLRKLLNAYPALTPDLLALSAAARRLRCWTVAAAPRLPSPFPPEQLCRLPSILARQSAQSWLIHHGMPPEKCTPATLDRLLLMAADAASPARQQFPGPLTLTRGHGQIAAH